MGAMAVPDVAGTKTVVISLATNDDGQILPLVMTSKSNGLEPVNPPSPSEEPTAWQDTNIEIIMQNTDEPVSEDASADSEQANNENNEDAAESDGFVEDEQNVPSIDEEVKAESDGGDSESEVNGESEVAEESGAVDEDASKPDGEAEYDSDSDADTVSADHEEPKSSANAPSNALSLMFAMCITA
ncbi:hypothetical protein IWW50_004928, partial [Coemansia erecta]